MKEEMNLAIKKFQNAFARLKTGVLDAKDELDKDGSIQRFEFTFELLWKTLKIFLESKGVEAKTPKDCLKAAFRIRLIEDEAVFLDMLEDRNKTSHVYHQEESERIFERIKQSYLPEIEKLLKKLIEKEDSD